MGALAGQFMLAADFGETVSDIQAADISGFTNTVYVPGSPVCGVSFVANTFGKAQLEWTSQAESNVAGNAVYVSVEVRTGAVVGAGDIVLAASDERAIAHGDASTGENTRLGASQTYPLTGLTPHATYNAQIVYRITGDNGDIRYRSVTVTPKH